MRLSSQGSFENLKLIRQAGVECPLLCKEFIVDAYQLMTARANGADAVVSAAAASPLTCRNPPDPAHSRRGSRPRRSP